MLQRYLGRRPSFVDGELYASSENLRSESLPLAAWHQPSEVSCRGDSADLVCKHLGTLFRITPYYFSRDWKAIPS